MYGTCHHLFSKGEGVRKSREHKDCHRDTLVEGHHDGQFSGYVGCNAQERLALLQGLSHKAKLGWGRDKR